MVIMNKTLLFILFLSLFPVSETFAQKSKMEKAGGRYYQTLFYIEKLYINSSLKN